MADYSEWLETTLGTDAFDDDIDQGALQQMTLQRQELDAVLCLVDCQLDMFQPIEIKENKNMNNNPLGVTNISITKEPLDDSTLFSNVAEDVSVSARTATAMTSSSSCSSVMTGKKCSDSSLKGSHTCTPFQNALRCVLKLYQDKIITSSKDIVGLVLYNTRVRHNIYDIPGVYLFHPFELLGIHCVQEVEELVAAGEIDSLAYERFEKKVGHSQEGETRLSDVLWASMHMFMRLRSDMIKYRRVFLFTNDDEPHRGDDLEKNRCLARVRDLHEIGVSLEVFAIGTNINKRVSGGDLSLEEYSSWGKEKRKTTEGDVEELFHGEKFWDHLRHAAANTSVINDNNNSDNNNDNNNKPKQQQQQQQHAYQEPYMDVVHIDSGPQAFNNLLSAVRRRTHPQHPYQRTVLTIGVSVNGSSVPTMAVSVFHPVMPVQTQRMEWLDSRTKKIVKRQTQHVVKTSSSSSSLLSEANKENNDNNKKTDEISIVNPENLLQSIVLGGRRLFVSPQEKERVIATTTNNVTIGFSILCFKHTEDILKHKHSLQKSSFLHPNLNDGGEGSLRLFVQLTRTLLQQNKVAVAQYLASRTAAPRLVALVPSPPSSSYSYSYSHPSMGLSSILSSSSSTPVEGLGLYVVPLPYAEDIRKVPTLPCFNDNTTPKPEDVDLAKRILSSLSVSYDIHAVPNPMLQHRLQLMQKMAIQQTTLEKGTNNTNELETVKDLSLPDREGMSHYANLFQEFNNTVLGTSYDADKLCQSYKPRVVAGVKTSREGELTDDSTNDAIVRLVKGAFENNALQTLTVLQLRSYLNAMGQSTDGARRKDDLIQVVTRVISCQK